jgi:hypothetical protein
VKLVLRVDLYRTLCLSGCFGDTLLFRRVGRVRICHFLPAKVILFFFFSRIKEVIIAECPETPRPVFTCWVPETFFQIIYVDHLGLSVIITDIYAR